ncbi:hypothetical protein EYC51_16925 [Alcaligenes faecalis]|jgi:hypothetical protein|nr:hypothetical protein EYC51_16925 [Alcaligenes faecalis]
MALDRAKAEHLATEIVLGLARVGALPVNNSVAVLTGATARNRGDSDAVYLATLFKRLSDELQK